MKTKVQRMEATFQPIVVEIVVETQKDLDVFNALYAYSNEIAEVIAKKTDAEWEEVNNLLEQLGAAPKE